MSDWLNNTFYNFDRGVFISMNNLAKAMGGFLTPLFKAITFLGNGGWFFILLGIVLILFKNTRKTGLAVLLSLLFGAIFTNIILKNIVARPRPYLVNAEYRMYWQSVWGKVQSEMSFPSGHSTASMAFAMAFYLAFNKKWGWVGFVLALVIGLTRLYFIVHYATDIVGGFMVGAIAGVIGTYLMKYLFSLIKKNKNKKFCAFILKADIKNLFNKSK